jgi:capsular exopolysaccharide synthesis family protein
LEAAVGLTDVLLGDVMLEDALQPWGNVAVLVAGSIPPNPSQLINSGTMRDLIETCEREFDFVVIDSGPVLSVADTLVLSHTCGGVLLIARCGRTTRRAFAQALAALHNADPRLIGTALTRVPSRGATRRYHYHSEAKPRRETFRASERRGKEPRSVKTDAEAPADDTTLSAR